MCVHVWSCNDYEVTMPIAITPVGVLFVSSEVNDAVDLIYDLVSGRVDSSYVSASIGYGAIVPEQYSRIFQSGLQGTMKVPPEGDSNVSLTTEFVDISYRPASVDGGLRSEAVSDMDIPGSSAYELLGSPGPSFDYDFQEDGISEAVVSAAASSGWPTTSRKHAHSTKYCYSRWLTVLGASIKVPVYDKASLKITARVGGQFNMFSSAMTSAPPTMNESNVRFAIIVDTNPDLRDDFPNTNPNIDSPYVSWKIVEDITINMDQRGTIEIQGELPVNGGGTYNIRLAYRRAGYFGYIEDGTGAFVEGVWELDHSGGHTNSPLVIDSLVPVTSTKFAPPWIVMFETSSILVEAEYGRDQSYVYDSNSSEFSRFERS